jgi:hypothetical protein
MVLGFGFFLFCLIAGKPGKLIAPGNSGFFFFLLLFLICLELECLKEFFFLYILKSCGYENEGIDNRDKKYYYNEKCVETCPNGFFFFRSGLLF